MKLSTPLIVVPMVLVASVLATANRHGVAFSLDPFNGLVDPLWVVELPLYVLLFTFFLMGVLAGGCAAWFGQGKWRKVARVTRREVKGLNKEVAAHREVVAITSETPPTEP